MSNPKKYFEFPLCCYKYIPVLPLSFEITKLSSIMSILIYFMDGQWLKSIDFDISNALETLFLFEKFSFCVGNSLSYHNVSCFSTKDHARFHCNRQFKEAGGRNIM